MTTDPSTDRWAVMLLWLAHEPLPAAPRLPDAELFDLLRQAERRGLLARVEFKGTDRKPRERWEVTPEGRATAGLAATAATAATTGVTASGADAAEPAATAATSPLGGAGERARTQTASGDAA